MQPQVVLLHLKQCTMAKNFFHELVILFDNHWGFLPHMQWAIHFASTFHQWQSHLHLYAPQRVCQTLETWARVAKIMLHLNVPTLMVNHTNTWENVKLMDVYLVAIIITILYPRFGIIIKMISHENTSYCVTIGTILQCKCQKFTNMSSHGLEKKMHVLQTSLSWCWL